MAFQNSIKLSNDEKFISFATQFLEYSNTPPIYFNILFSIGTRIFKFPDIHIRELEREILIEKSHIREVLFDSTIDHEIYNRYDSLKTKLSPREKIIIWSFCLAELRTVSDLTIEKFEDQIQSIFKISKKQYNEIHRDINVLNYLSKSMISIFNR